MFETSVHPRIWSVSIKLPFPSHFDDFNRNSHTFQRSTIEIEGKNQDFTIVMSSFYTPRNSDEVKQISYGDLYK